MRFVCLLLFCALPAVAGPLDRFAVRGSNPPRAPLAPSDGVGIRLAAHEQPPLIGRDLEPTDPPAPNLPPSIIPTEYQYPPPLGYSGPSSVLPRSGSNPEYDTVEDRWRIGFPEWDRYGDGQKQVFDRPYMLGRKLDPFGQHVLKGDYPILGQNVFVNISGTAASLAEGRSIPTATTPFESTARPNTRDFFGKPGQFITNNLLTASVDLFRGDAAFKPVDWRLKVTPAVNINTLRVQELAVVSPDVRKGVERNRSWVTLQEWFAEAKLADLSAQYDFLSIRAGSQPFVSDFRGFIFSDVNRGVRLFGNFDGNRTQYNLAYFRQQEKDTNSGLNTFKDRNQNIVVANVYRQDFLTPGYTASASFHFNSDGPSTLFDSNRFLVRPDPAGVFQQHQVNAGYLGIAGDGHIGRYNISNAFYWAFGRDTLNPIAGTPQTISAYLAALELSYDRDWVRFRLSGLYQSGDGDPNNSHATGFDGIIDQTNFGGEFAYWRRNRIPLFGVGLTNDQSQYANLRSSRIQGQSNFVNPGLFLAGGGIDFDITPRLRSVNNVNALFFDKTASLRTFTFQENIDRFIGTDISTGFEWRPKLNNNVIVTGGLAALVPGGAFRQLYNPKDGTVPTLFSGFVELVLAF